MEGIGLELGGSHNYLQDLTVGTDGSNLLEIIDQNVPGYHRVTKTDPFQDPLEDEPMCMHRHHLLTPGAGFCGGANGSMTSALCETSSLDFSPNITEDFQKMYSDWQQHLGSLQGASDEDFLTELMYNLAEKQDQEEASDEEDLVVDEVVSLSMVGKNSRQRSESICSISGPFVPPDLLLNTNQNQQEILNSIEVKEEDVLTEIAGVFDDSTLLAEDLISAQFTQEELNQLVKEEVVTDALFNPNVLKQDDLQYLSTVQNATPAPKEKNTILTDSNIENAVTNSTEIKANVQSQSSCIEQPAKGLEKSKPVADTNGLDAQALNEKVKAVQALQGNRMVNIDGKEVKLPAGSIILAVVNESGSLVPLPQLQVTPQSLTRVVKTDTPEKGLDEEIDIETVSEKTPVLEAGDLDSLLAQFEASEAVNKSSGETPNEDKSAATDQTKAGGSSGHQTQGRGPSVPGIVPLGISPQGSPTHQKIRDALPKEIIEKIKASTKRKSTQMLSEVPSLRKGRVVRQQESVRAKVSRTSAQSSQNSGDERVPPPMDHDYCFSPDKQKALKLESSDKSDDKSLSKLPDYCTTNSRRQSKKASVCSDDGGKKDSGVESGDVSDASVETEERKKEGKDGKSGHDFNNQNKLKRPDNTDVYDKIPAYITDIGNVKPKEEKEENEEEKEEESAVSIKPEIKKTKRKLNLSEYRQRIRSTQSSRCPSPNQGDSGQMSPKQEELPISDLVQKMEEEKAKTEENANIKPTTENNAAPLEPEEDTEEGELKGDSDPEVPGKDQLSTAVSACPEQNLHLAGTMTPEKTMFPAQAVSCSSAGSTCSRDSKRKGRTSTRRWSSSSRSRSRSRSHSRSPSKRSHMSRKHRSSRGKRRRRHRRSRSSVSPYSSSRRRWSRSRSRSHSHSSSRSRSRGRSMSSCTSSSSCCSSRSRSRSRSARARDRWGYSRRFSRSRDRRRRSHSRSRSRSSSWYSGRVTRSRSPIRQPRRSRSPPPRFPPRIRRPDEERVRQVEERRVIYIGRIEERTTKADLRQRFQKYGTIVDISVHFREHGDNYGFVTYQNRDEAYQAVEKGNEDPSLPKYDLCFGGRRAFCKVQYSDLDAQNESYMGGMGRGGGYADFDSLLREAMKKSR